MLRHVAHRVIYLAKQLDDKLFRSHGLGALLDFDTSGVPDVHDFFQLAPLVNYVLKTKPLLVDAGFILREDKRWKAIPATKHEFDEKIAKPRRKFGKRLKRTKDHVQDRAMWVAKSILYERQDWDQYFPKEAEQAVEEVLSNI